MWLNNQLGSCFLQHFSSRKVHPRLSEVVQTTIPGRLKLVDCARPDSRLHHGLPFSHWFGKLNQPSRFFWNNNVSCETAPKLHMSNHQLPAKGFLFCIHRVQVDDFPLRHGPLPWHRWLTTTFKQRPKVFNISTSPAAPTSSPTVCRGASRWLRSIQRVGQRYRPHKPPPREWSPPNRQSLAASFESACMVKLEMCK